MGEKREYRRRRRPPEDMELQQRQVRRRQTQEPHRQPRRHRSVQEEQPYIDPRRVAQGRRMSRRKAERKKRRRRNILVVILLLLLLVAAYAGAKIWVAVQQWENKAEKSVLQHRIRLTPRRMKSSMLPFLVRMRMVSARM